MAEKARQSGQCACLGDVEVDVDEVPRLGSERDPDVVTGAEVLRADLGVLPCRAERALQARHQANQMKALVRVGASHPANRRLDGV